MKNLFTIGFLAICLLNCSLGSSQAPIPGKQQIHHKTFLFCQFSDKTVNAEALNMSIRSSNFHGALFTHSVKTPLASAQKIMGRIIHSSSAIYWYQLRKTIDSITIKQQQEIFL